MENSIPIFSIIIPVFNRASVILNALQSVKAQVFNNFECIIIDDYSSDNSTLVVEDCIKNDSRFTLLKHSINKGAAAARNTGIQNAKGKYISFLDSDDFLDSKFLSETYNLISHTDESTGFVWTGYRLISQNKGIEQIIEKVWIPSGSGNTYCSFLNSLQIGIGAGVTIKREVFLYCGLFDVTLPAAEDTEFFLRVAQKYNYAVIKKILINIQRAGQDRLSKRYDKIYDAYTKLLPAHITMINKSKKLRIKYNYKMQWLSYYGRNKNEARKYFNNVLKDEFLNFKSWYIFLSFEILGIKWASRLHDLISIK